MPYYIFLKKQIKKWNTKKKKLEVSLANRMSKRFSATVSKFVFFLNLSETKSTIY